MRETKRGTVENEDDNEIKESERDDVVIFGILFSMLTEYYGYLIPTSASALGFAAFAALPINIAKPSSLQI